MDTRRNHLSGFNPDVELKVMRYHQRHNNIGGMLDSIQGLLMACCCTNCNGTGWGPPTKASITEWQSSKHGRKPCESTHTGDHQIIIDKDGKVIERIACKVCRCRGSVHKPWAKQCRRALYWCSERMRKHATTLTTTEINLLVASAGKATSKQSKIRYCQRVLCLYGNDVAAMIFKHATAMSSKRYPFTPPIKKVIELLRKQDTEFETIQPVKRVLIRIANLVTMLPNETKPTCHKCDTVLTTHRTTRVHNGCKCRVHSLNEPYYLDTINLYSDSLFAVLGESLRDWLLDEWRYVAQPGVKINRQNNLESDKLRTESVIYKIPQLGGRARISIVSGYTSMGVTVNCRSNYPCPPLPKYIVPEA